MSKFLLLVGAVGAGAAALYLMDEKEGKKRRARLKKKLESGFSTAEDMWGEYSKELRERAPEISRHLGERAQSLGKTAQEYLKGAGERAGDWSRGMGKSAADYAVVGGKRAGEYVKEGNVRWSPSARMIGAVGSALAFYGAGRPGIFGIMLRTLSLGLFTRALLASR